MDPFARDTTPLDSLLQSLRTYTIKSLGTYPIIK